jgi:hypothetical protein
MRRLPRVVCLYVALQIAQPVLFELVGALSGPINKRGSAFVALLLVGLAYRSRMAWTLLLLMNAVLALPVLTILGGGNALWTHVAAAVGTGVALVALLASRQRREHVWSRRYSVTAAP